MVYVEMYVVVGMKLNVEVEKHHTIPVVMILLSRTVHWWVPVTLING